MTTVSAYGTAALATLRAQNTFRSLKSELGDLQTQLTTGKRATTYAGLGDQALRSLSARATMSSLDAYGANVTDAQLRLKLMASGVGQIDKAVGAVRDGLSGSYEQTEVGRQAALATASAALDLVVDVLNTDSAGRYLFSGRATDTKPVASSDLILNGDGERAGLKQYVAERQAADAGADGLGRLSLEDTGNGIRIAEDAASFGIKVTSASASGTGLAAAREAGPPAAASLSVAAQPAAGDAITLTLALPDGSSTTLSLTADGTGAGAFAIGGTAAETAANLRAAVRASIAEVAGAPLTASSALAASRDFFAGTSSAPPPRVAGPPFETATGMRPGTAADTVIWYGGDDVAGSARETAPVRTGEGVALGIGARATEPAFRKVLAGIGALLAQDFSGSTASAAQFYAATASTVTAALGDGVEPVLSDYALLDASLASAKERVDGAKAQVEDTIAGAEDADPNEVAMKLLAAQTRLQASYQTTATIAKLSLVDFL